MSSPDIHSPYSYPSEVTISSPAVEQHIPPPENTTERRAPPRLSSPHHFRDIFAAESGSNSSRHNWNLPPINYRETMDGVNRALQSANRAIQNAQEAFQSRRHPLQNPSYPPRPDVVDLTASPPNAATRTVTDERSLDAFLSRIHPHDAYARQTGPNQFLNEPVYGTQPPSFFRRISEDAHTESDSLAGPRRRFEMSRRTNIGIPNIERHLMRSAASDVRRQDEEDAIRRQRVARQQWEQNQKRLSETQRLAAQRQRLLSSPESQRNAQLPSSTNTQSRPNTSSSGTSTLEAVDLTNVDDNDTLSEVLSKQRIDAIASQNTTTSSTTNMKDNLSDETNGRTPLTTYKCPICMEPPQFPTSTACGHLFCHKCIIDTLKWSENMRRDEVPPHRKVKGVCPVCRKQMARVEKSGNTRTLIALEIKALTKGELKRKRDEEECSKRKEHKGKGRARSEDGSAASPAVIEDDDDEEGGEIQAATASRTRKRAKKTPAKREYHSAADDDDLFGTDGLDEYAFRENENGQWE